RRASSRPPRPPQATAVPGAPDTAADGFGGSPHGAAKDGTGADRTAFADLGNRTLTLVEHQLGIIEGLEEREADPDRLDTLFKLDHLATRMRRHSENLLLLAGYGPHRAPRLVRGRGPGAAACWTCCARLSARDSGVRAGGAGDPGRRRYGSPDPPRTISATWSRNSSTTRRASPRPAPEYV
ncbi:hypothetical protein IHE61_00005, partial [Streptomyces sp. GKU 257-1]|nr:hypothetical protein [Streptomyces sp. GKU 257-1]